MTITMKSEVNTMMTLKEMISFMHDMQAEYEFEHFVDIDYISTVGSLMEGIAAIMMENHQF